MWFFRVSDRSIHSSEKCVAMYKRIFHNMSENAAYTVNYNLHLSHYFIVWIGLFYGVYGVPQRVVVYCMCQHMFVDFRF